VTLAVTGKTISGRDFRSQRTTVFERHRNAVDRKSTGHAVSDRSSNEADILCIFLCICCISGGGFGKVL
jgi:hypothetical protein